MGEAHEAALRRPQGVELLDQALGLGAELELAPQRGQTGRLGPDLNPSSVAVDTTATTSGDS